MPSFGLRRPSLTALAASHARREDLPPLAISVALLAALVGIDAALGSAAIVGGFVVVPMAVAFVARPWVTQLIAAAATILAIASPLWTTGTEGIGDLAMIAIVGSGSLFAVAGAWKRERARTRVSELELLDAVGKIADGSLPLAQTLAQVVELVAPLAADLCMVDSISRGRVNRIAVHAPGAPGGAVVVEGIRKRQPSTPDWLMKAEPEREITPFYVPRMTDEVLVGLSHGPEDLEFLRSLGVRSAMILPMVARRRVLGTLTMIVAWSGRRYGPEDLRFAELLASRVALALDSAGLFSDLESLRRRMDNAMAILREAVVIHDGDGSLVYANPAAAETIGFESAAQLLAAGPEEVADRFAIHDESQGPLSLWDVARASSDSSPAGAEGQVVVRPARGGADERWYAIKSAALTGPAGASLFHVTAIEDVTAMKRAEIGHRMLAETAELLTAAGDFRSMLQEVAELAVPEFADWCAVNLAGDRGLLEQLAVAHSDPAKVRLAEELRQRYPVHLSERVGIPEVIRTGVAQVVQVPDELIRAGAVDAEHERRLRELGLGSVIMAPMTVGGRVLGAIAFVNDGDSRAFDRTDLEVAQEVAVRAGTAVEIARVSSQRAEIAGTLQRSLLPATMPEMDGWEVATMYRPAGELNEVGGDFYDAFSIDGGWVVAIGDVVGRGATAASLTSLARHTIRTACKITRDPPTALRMLNEALTRRAETALCTVALIVLSETSSAAAEAVAYSAGHPLPLLLSGERVAEVGRPGPLLGAIEGHGWRPQAILLQPGDQLVVYTDGVTEARGEGGRFGEERLRRRLAGTPDPIRAVARIEAALDEFLPDAPQDDAAMVVVRRSGAHSVLVAGGFEASASGVPEPT